MSAIIVRDNVVPIVGMAGQQLQWRGSRRQGAVVATFQAPNGTPLGQYTCDQGGALQCGSGWTIQSGRAVCDPELGDDLYVSGVGDFTASDDPSDYHFTPYAPNTVSIDTALQYLEMTYGGDHRGLHTTFNAANGLTGDLAKGQLYKLVFRGKSLTGGGQHFLNYTLSGVSMIRYFGSDFVSKHTYFIPIPAGHPTFSGDSFSSDATYDYFRIFPVAMHEIMAVARSVKRDVMVSATVWPSAEPNWVGVVACADSIINPRSLLLAVYDTNNVLAGAVKLLKWVNGVPSTLISSYRAPVAGAEIQLQCAGGVAKLYYNGGQVGGAADVSDVFGTYHGIVSTDNGASVGGLRIA